MIYGLKRVYSRLICRLFGHKFCEHYCCHRCGYVPIYKLLEPQFVRTRNVQISEMNKQIWGEDDAKT